ncbi:hypothetical protein [Aquisalimonas sp.]|uniref:hypothetical protein n=1 Tax=Aquisalimonas sp. TaxID=1872621 RepID=UPI0025C6EAE6|nr:hypothetical protein [Aquisalimonas sp.]
MTDLFRTLLRICLFQSGPQDMPAATSILAVLIALGWGASILVLEQLGAAGPVAVEVTFATAFALLFTWLALRLRQLPSRFTQTASALFGTDLLLLIPATPLLLATAGGEAPTLQLALLALWLWSIAIKGHIFRHALDIPVSGGIAVAVLYTLLSLFLTGGA